MKYVTGLRVELVSSHKQSPPNPLVFDCISTVLSAFILLSAAQTVVLYKSSIIIEEV